MMYNSNSSAKFTQVYETYAQLGTYSRRSPKVVHNLAHIRRGLRKLCITWNILQRPANVLQRPAKVMHHLAHIHWALRIYWERPTKVLLLMARHTYAGLWIGSNAF